MKNTNLKPMKIFMDRHDVGEPVNAEHVAELHQLDLEIQDRFDCKGLTYWFDDKRKTAFCLFEAPDRQAIQNLHDHAHGNIPHRIIEVDQNIVESFLGRIEDPIKPNSTGLNIIDDPAFRSVMVINLAMKSFNDVDPAQRDLLFQNCGSSIPQIVYDFDGRIVKQEYDYFLISFESVTQAVLCAIEVQYKFKKLIDDVIINSVELKIGLNAGIPITEKDNFFEDAIKSAERMCNVSNAGIVVSTEIKDLYKSENSNSFFNNQIVSTIEPGEELFLNRLMDYTEKTWTNTDVKVEDFCKHLGYSKTQLYRKMTSITGKSPNTFLKNYRLGKALKLLNKRSGNVSQIAFETGFCSPSYFSKCFFKSYGQPPSYFLRNNIS